MTIQGWVRVRKASGLVGYGALTMLRLLTCTLLLICAFASSTTWGDGRRVVRLPVEERTTVHVGDYVVVAIPSNLRYHVGLAGNPLLPARLSGHRGELVYRAVSVGSAALVLSPVVPSGQ